MKYILRTLGVYVPVEIEEATFLAAREATDALVTMIAVEQKFDLLVENYADYERELLELSLQKALRSDFEWASFQDDIAGVSRRLANLLSAARLYLDHVKHDLSSTFGAESDVTKTVKSKTAEQYDAKFGYRVMEELRNVMQHRSIPVHSISFPHENIEAKLRHRAVPRVDVFRLKDAKIKPRIFKELEAKGTSVDLTPLVREYIEGLGIVHEAVRERAAPQVTGWDATLVRTQALGAQPNGGNPKSAVLALKMDKNDKVIETVQVFTDLIGYRQDFERRNRTLSSLPRRYVSSECV